MVGDPSTALDTTDVSTTYGRALDQERWADLDEVGDALRNWVDASYRELLPSASLIEFQEGSATYTFDCAGTVAAERTVMVLGGPLLPSKDRDVAYQRGYPLPADVAGRPVDRGHFMPYTGGGGFGPNLFVQDRALNRGWSAEGRTYRRMETRAVASPGVLLGVRPIYVDSSDVPGFVELSLTRLHCGTVDVVARRFRNRYDLPLGPEEDELAVLLGGATDGQLGALGEETAAVVLEDEFGATMVSMGDAGMPRDEGRQDLDLLVMVEGALVAVEVKTRYNGSLAGRLTRSGWLPAPRLRRGTQVGRPRQGSQHYVRDRLARTLDTRPDAYDGIDVVAAVIDLKAMRAQLFDVDDAGRRTSPRTAPVPCRGHVEVAWGRIQAHRGHL